MSRRLEMLEKLAAAPTSDPFALYALALEYRKEGRTDDALRTFERLRSLHPDYVPAYLMAGQLLGDAGREAEARQWLARGVEVATARGDTHARSELLAALGED